MRFVLAIAFVLLAGCGHDSSRPVVSYLSPQLEPITVAADSTWHVLGGIVDAETDEPLISANVILQYQIPGNNKILTTGAATWIDGKYSIVIRSIQKPNLLKLVASYITYKTVSPNMQQFSGSDSLHLGFLGLRWDGPFNMDWDGHCYYPPMFDKTQTNSHVVVTEEDIRNLPIPK